MTQTAVANRLPDWLKAEGAIAWHNPSRTLFVPQRVLRRTPQGVCLLDYEGREHPFRECQEARPEHLKGIALFIPESGYAVSVYPLAIAGTFTVSDGKRRTCFQIESDEVARAAKALAKAFDGAIYSEEVTA